MLPRYLTETLVAAYDGEIEAVVLEAFEGTLAHEARDVDAERPSELGGVGGKLGDVGGGVVSGHGQRGDHDEREDEDGSEEWRHGCSGVPRVTRSRDKTPSSELHCTVCTVHVQGIGSAQSRDCTQSI